MKLEARLDSAVFQLTPTRTRCDLVIIANGKTEKIATGLLNPFVSHLKTAQDQIAKGGYSIKLEPDPNSEAAWFTKGTVERFVRFVSTPEVLERVNTIESEILQIEEAIPSQGNDKLGSNTVEEQLKPFGSSEGNMQMRGVDSEKTIVPYKNGCHPNPVPLSNESKTHEENSKVQLVRVLETRKKVLQKEQAMAFARTAAAGFEMENTGHLMAFAESFGASRLREACSRYTQLWEGKHESGQWIEIEAAEEALSCRSELPPLNTSGIIFSEDTMKQKDFIEAWPASAGDAGIGNNANAISQESDRDKRHPSEPQLPLEQPVYQGPFQYPPFPQWSVHSQQSPYLFQPYPMQSMPYYQNYPVDGQFPHPPYSPMEDPNLNIDQSKGKKQHSKHSKDVSSYSDDGTGQNTSEYEEEPSKVCRSHKKVGHSGKNKGVVVIRNLNYIAAKRHDTSGNKFEPSSDSEIDDIKDMFLDHGGRDHKPSSSLKREDDYQETAGFSNVHDRDEESYKQEADAGNWQAFQSFLLEAEQKMTSAVDGDMFAGEKEPPVKKLQNKDEPDPILLSRRDSSNYKEEYIMENDAFRGKGGRIREAVSTDYFVTSTEDRIHLNCQTDAQFKEVDVGVGRYRKDISDDFITYGLEKQIANKISSDPLVDFEHENVTIFEKSSSPNVADESFVVPFRSEIQDQIGIGTRFAIDMDSEFRSAAQKEDFSSKAATIVSYEPDDLTLILENTRESESVGYNQTVYSDIQVPLIIKQEGKKEEDDVLASFNEGFIKTDEVKLKPHHSELEKKRKGASTNKTTLMRSTPLSEAQKRAEKLRNYKSDLQKLKKEHEDEEIRRLESLKREQQKRIALRNGSKAVQSPLNPHQSNPGNSSKFKDPEIGSSLPLQKLPMSNVSNKVIKNTTSNKSSHAAISLPELKGSEKQEGNSLSARIRRLPEPKSSTVHSVPAKSASPNRILKKPLAEVPRSKKIPAIIQLDKTNSEALPELKITADGASAEVLQNKPAAKQQNVAGSMILESHCNEMNPEKNQKLSHIDDYPLIVKTVAIFENEVIPANHAQTSEGMRIDADHAVANSLIGIYSSSSSPIGRVCRENQTEDNQNDPINSFEKLLDPAVRENQEKPHNQKGLRKLWKFGRKDHHSSHLGDGDLLSYESTVDEDMMLAPNDISRPFSILASFRGRNNEKKIVASA